MYYGYPTYTTANVYYTTTTTSSKTNWSMGAYVKRVVTHPPEPEPEPCTEDELIEFINGKESYNKNCVPNERRSPVQTSGVRIGTVAKTTKGKTAEDL